MIQIGQEVLLSVIGFGYALVGTLVILVGRLVNNRLKDDKKYLIDRLDILNETIKDKVARTTKEIDLLRSVRHEDRDLIFQLQQSMEMIKADFQAVIQKTLNENKDLRIDLLQVRTDLLQAIADFKSTRKG